MKHKDGLLRCIPPKVLEPLPFGDGDPSMYEPAVVETLFRLGLQHARGLHTARNSKHYREDAERFRRRVEIINVLRFLPPGLRKRPFGAATIEKVLEKLERIGIDCEIATLRRDYKVLRDAGVLYSIQPASEGEDPGPVIRPAEGALDS